MNAGASGGDEFIQPAKSHRYDRLGTIDAEAAYRRLRAAGTTLHDDDVLHLEGAPPMFSVADPDGNGLVHNQEPERTADDR